MRRDQADDGKCEEDGMAQAAHSGLNIQGSESREQAAGPASPRCRISRQIEIADPSLAVFIVEAQIHNLYIHRTIAGQLNGSPREPQSLHAICPGPDPRAAQRQLAPPQVVVFLMETPYSMDADEFVRRIAVNLPAGGEMSGLTAHFLFGANPPEKPAAEQAVSGTGNTGTTAATRGT
jgi:hypothetical protein